MTRIGEVSGKQFNSRKSQFRREKEKIEWDNCIYFAANAKLPLRKRLAVDSGFLFLFFHLA